MSNCCFAVLIKQCFKLISCDFLLLKKKCCTSVKHIAVLCYHALCLVVRLVDDALYLDIDCRCYALAVVLCMGEVSSDEDLLLIIGIADKADIV